MTEEQKQPENPVENPEVAVDTSLENQNSVPESAVELDETTEINPEDHQTAENEEIFADEKDG